MKGFLNYNKGDIFYEVIGEENTDTIVFVHGFSLDNRMWHQQKDFFKGSYKVVTYDMRGFGKSSLPVTSYSHHDDLKQLLNMLDVKSCNLVGLSLGGEVAIDFTIENKNFVKKLVLMDSSLGGYSSTVNWDVKAKEMGVENAKSNWLRHEVFTSTRNKKMVLEELTKIVNDYSGWHWVNPDPRLKLKPPAISRLHQIASSTLIMTGEDDLQYFKDISDILLSNVKNSTKEIIGNAGHMINMENTKLVNSLLNNFIKI